MPIYEYRCSSCDHLLEALQQVGEDPLRDCPACSRDTLRRRISAPAFRFKGSGWYETDFKTGKRKNLADSGGETKAESDAKGEGEKKKKDDTGASSEGQKSSDQKAGAASKDSKESGSAATGS